MRFPHRIASAVSLVLYASAATAQQASQSPTPTRFVVLDYMKVAPGKVDEYVRLEQQVWKPLHQQRVTNKEMVAWALYEVAFTADTHREYDYVTANVYDNVGATEATGLLAAFQRLHPGQVGTRLLTQTGAARQIVRSEIWTLLDQTTPMSTANSPAAPSKYLVVDFMRSKTGDYETVERELWKPIHQDRVKSGAADGWALYGLVLPGGTSYPYDYATVNARSSLSGIIEMYPDDLFKRVLPNISLTDIGNRTGASRDLTRRELWVRVDGTR
jgi:hypothetical protein